MFNIDIVITKYLKWSTQITNQIKIHFIEKKFKNKTKH